MNDTIAVFITWTTYGTWLPGDLRGWRKRKGGHQLPRPLLADWCRKQMKGEGRRPSLIQPSKKSAVSFGGPSEDDETRAPSSAALKGNGREVPLIAR